MALRLRIVTPTRLVVETEVSELTAPGVVGEFGVLPEHATFLGSLDTGTLTYVEGGVKRRLVVHGGYAEVIDDVVTVLADDAEFPEEIDGRSAREDLARIEAELDKDQETREAVDTLLRDRRRAEVRIEAAG